MPTDTLSITRQLYKKMTMAKYHRIAQKILNHIENTAISHYIVHTATRFMPINHFVTVPPRR